LKALAARGAGAILDIASMSPGLTQTGGFLLTHVIALNKIRLLNTCHREFRGCPHRSGHLESLLLFVLPFRRCRCLQERSV